jgi:probable rRNA maturation factor
VVSLVAEVPVDPAIEAAVAERLDRLMRELGVGDKAVTVVFTDDATIRELKKRHWGEDAATDVLAFPTFEPGDPFVPPHLGDVVISLDTARRQAEAAGRTLEEEVLVLAAHALWHLLGHDHRTEEEWQGFRNVQARILEL